MPKSTSGIDGTPSARRTFPFLTPVGETVDVTEGIHSYHEDGHGGFKLEFDIANAPIHYGGGSWNGTGTYAGGWDTLQIQSVGAEETKVDWGIYACYTGYNSKPPSGAVWKLLLMHYLFLDNSAAHELAINNVITILQEQGKLTGKTTPPTSHGD